MLFSVILPLVAAHSMKLGTKGMVAVFAVCVGASYGVFFLFPGLLQWPSRNSTDRIRVWRRVAECECWC